MVKVSFLFVAFVAFGFSFHGSVANHVQGVDHGKAIGVYELKKGNMSVKFTNWGATIMSVVLPDKNGKLDDVVLGYDTVNEYKNDSVYFGSIVGRVANRIGGAQFSLNSTIYKLVANEGKNTLHGGGKGFSDLVWDLKHHKNKGHAPSIGFTYNSFDREQGFPGDLRVAVTYILSGNNDLRVKMRAKAVNMSTPVNLAQHTYWNLGGHNSGDIVNEEIQIFASNYTPVTTELIPTGEIKPVEETPYDFLKSHAIGDNIKKLLKGYDINYALDGSGSHMKTAAVVLDKKSGRKMELMTNAPGLQFYTGNLLKEVKGKGGFVYRAHAGLCLETQHFPDSVNQPNFPSTILAPRKIYEHRMLYKFSTFS